MRIILRRRFKDNAASSLPAQAIALDPNDADGYVTLGVILAFAERPEEAIGLIEKAMRLNPHYPVSYLSNLEEWLSWPIPPFQTFVKNNNDKTNKGNNGKYGKCRGKRVHLRTSMPSRI
ncbi:MAG: tetratricopeptide repeat protein [Deltaproteobacteria bacterium]|nr:tetratricopeptide repeat protein [Deltaproteobacteria bacterium]